ncbi:MAG TPA: DNA-processing protein DprA [Flavisolibacter sp.]|nr:DNA-processing protein DprA [Flavisolibacter sp.]
MNERLYQLALTLVPNIGDIQAKILISYLGDAESIFKAKKQTLKKIEGLNATAIHSLTEFNNFERAEIELAFIEKHKIKILFFTDKGYPKRLLNCAEGPALLFHKGNIDFNNSKIVSIVGTRSFSDYGKQLTETLIRDLAEQNIMIISGLAYGIDAIAHKESLKNNLLTVGVVGHGLDMIYPPENANLAKDMINNSGGLLSEFFSGIIPDRHHFPLRNRIVAGMSDATIVIETPIKGGSMITAKLADSYNRDVFAAPGRTTDKGSSGCNYLIKHNKAMMFTDADDVMSVMGWKDIKKENTNLQKTLFIELSAEEQKIYDLLQEKETVHIDEINLRSGLSNSNIASAILNLELQNVVKSMPGKMYRII